MQDVLVRARAKWRRVAAAERPEAYVRRMVLNEYLGWRRRRSSRDVVTAPGRFESLAGTVRRRPVRRAA